MYRGMPRGYPRSTGHTPAHRWPSHSEPLMSDTIDLNSAAIEQLNRLPGINDELAGRIVSYREEHGPFGSLDDLRHVAGVNDAIVQDLLGRPRLANRPPPVALRTYTAIRMGVVAVIVA